MYYLKELYTKVKQSNKSEMFLKEKTDYLMYQNETLSLINSTNDTILRIKGDKLYIHQERTKTISENNIKNICKIFSDKLLTL